MATPGWLCQLPFHTKKFKPIRCGKQSSELDLRYTN